MIVESKRASGGNKQIKTGSGHIHRLILNGRLQVQVQNITLVPDLEKSVDTVTFKNHIIHSEGGRKHDRIQLNLVKNDFKYQHHF